MDVYRRCFLFAVGVSIGMVSRANCQDVDQSSQTKLPQADRHIYLLIGQSNMAGRAPFDEKDAGVMDGCELFNSNNQWESAKNPLNRFSTIRKNIGMQKMNPGYAFALSMKKSFPDSTISLVVNAKGGSKIEEWAKGTRFYDDAVKRTRIAMKTGRLKGVLWHQGEGNSSMPEPYLGKLKQLVTNLRKDLKTPDLAFVAGQIKGKEKINDMIAKLPKEMPNTGVASSQGLTTFDRWHFDTKSMKMLGQRYAAEMIKIIKK